MRIVAGAFRGRALASLGKGDAAAHLRPTSDRVRESLFSMLTHRDVIAGARVLDLFAGTGALGLEALSRGSDSAVFVDNGRTALGLIQKNVNLCRVADRVKILRQDAIKLGTHDAAPFDLVFLDPPYGKNLGAPALVAALAGGWLAKDATIVWEEGTDQSLPDGFIVLDQRRFGQTRIAILGLQTDS